MNEQTNNWANRPETDYALGFQPDGVQLMRRTALGWSEQDKVAFDDGLRDGLAGFARRLEAENARPLSLVIPDDQILYTELTLPDAADADTALRSALDGLTPYAVEELAYDYAPQGARPGSKVRIAAVARQTLAEAEDFAVRHGFAPQRFIAAPSEGQFPHMPDFGATTVAVDADGAVGVKDVAAAVKQPPSQDQKIWVSRITPHAIAAPAGPGIFALARAKVAAARSETPVLVNSASVVLPGDEPAEGPAAEAMPQVEPKPVGPHDDIPAVKAASEPEKPLPERARIFHERAREARAQRDRDGTRRAVPKQPSRRSRLSGALPLVGLLVLGLGIAAAVIGRDPEPVDANAQPSAPIQPAETAQTEALPPAAQPVETVQATTATAPASQGTVAADQNTVIGLDDASTAAQPGEAISLSDSQRVAQLGSEPTVESSEAASAVSADAASTDVARPANAQPPQPSPEAASTEAPDATQPVAETTAQPAAETVQQPPAAPASSPLTTADAPEARPAQPGEAATATQPAETAPAAAPVLRRSVRPSSRPANLARRAAPAPAASGTASGGGQSDALQEALEQAVSSSSRPSSPPAANPGAPQSSTLSVSARPVSAPSRSAAPAERSASPDPRPAVPRNPQPYEQRELPEPTGLRPPPKPADISSARGAALHLQPAPRQFRMFSAETYAALEGILDRPWSNAPIFSASTPNAVRVAQARPARRPVQSDAVDTAVAAALSDNASSAPAPKPAATPSATAAPSRQAAAQTGTSLSRSGRPASRPKAGSSASNAAVEDAIAAAVSSSSAVPGQVPLKPLKSSARPARRAASAAGSATSAAVNAALKDAKAAKSAASSQEGTLAPEPQQAAKQSKADAEAAALAERRRLDDELQRQAEERVRARAAADAQAAAKAKAAAEARARAQAEAEAAAARKRNETYRPPEVDNEPEVQAAAAASAGKAAASATAKGIDLNATQLIGTVGAGKASRGLVRLRNGKIVTVRLGDKINGGEITQIGNGGLQYVKAGRTYALPILNGR
ncbi:hypothetical protein [Paracoccus sp. SCSIO 75233]|uniref:hypothetical protein n=1 Tax=Paracoccus sp. SCSIO 75233 TaxID=3017782 RepID=UPI0022F0AD7A|nr:hypothetical protein [Paracoccus sp. SCSIO 75233]WBU52264.1 hypothetical protein PAF12_10510 [Paracoccus sp. SCSIO 75233]